MAKSIHFWSDSKYLWITSTDTADFHGECLLLQELQRLQKTYELLLKLCVILTLCAVAFQVNSVEATGITPPTPIIQITLFARPPKLPPSHTEKSQEKIKFFILSQRT
ncbi:internalin N-terminal domain-containing protein [Anaerocolumna sp. AGMB13020]|uniref:internalin N-terminal domain-containing protein n=1 Tax=Anaerocolumna sp. AGMB13020 TaxID=3081750 RepID=UPI002954E9EE|nr:internalin N-terminal domain-containing protein [Anaerocolumna sp. AGMB13020]WOO35663.1 internalin N-terminal domain-containing protein [Anaerocolumna sp. AGMB13020]